MKHRHSGVCRHAGHIKGKCCRKNSTFRDGNILNIHHLHAFHESIAQQILHKSEILHLIHRCLILCRNFSYRCFDCIAICICARGNAGHYTAHFRTGLCKHGRRC